MPVFQHAPSEAGESGPSRPAIKADTARVEPSETEAAAAQARRVLQLQAQPRQAEARLQVREDVAVTEANVAALLQAERQEMYAAAQLDAEIAAVAEEIRAQEIGLEIAALEATLQGKQPKKGTWADLEQRVTRAEERARIAEVRCQTCSNFHVLPESELWFHIKCGKIAFYRQLAYR